MLKKIIFFLVFAHSFHAVVANTTPSTSVCIDGTNEAQNILFKAVENNDTVLVQKLLTNNFKDTSSIYRETFYQTDFGTPLFFVKSLSMAQLLLAHRFDPLVCDAHGFTASQAIAATKDRRFASPQEKAAIIALYKSKEAGHTIKKFFYQICYNDWYRATASLAIFPALFGYIILKLPVKK